MTIFDTIVEAKQWKIYVHCSTLPYTLHNFKLLTYAKLALQCSLPWTALYPKTKSHSSLSLYLEGKEDIDGIDDGTEKTEGSACLGHILVGDGDAEGNCGVISLHQHNDSGHKEEQSQQSAQ